MTLDWVYYDPKFDYEEMFFDIGRPWSGHKFFGYDLVRNFKPQRIVELGTAHGTSFFSFCQAVKDAHWTLTCMLLIFNNICVMRRDWHVQ